MRSVRDWSPAVRAVIFLGPPFLDALKVIEVATVQFKPGIFSQADGAEGFLGVALAVPKAAHEELDFSHGCSDDILNVEVEGEEGGCGSEIGSKHPDCVKHPFKVGQLAGIQSVFFENLPYTFQFLAHKVQSVAG